jgi:hypothetical protein
LEYRCAAMNAPPSDYSTDGVTVQYIALQYTAPGSGVRSSTYDRIDSSALLPKLRFSVSCMAMIACGPTRIQYRTDYRHSGGRRFVLRAAAHPHTRTHSVASQT